MRNRLIEFSLPSWAIELRDTGTYGFTLPANQIVAAGEESYAGQKYLWANF
jgi:hypothetical protein